VVKHPQKKTFWGNFSFSGVGSLKPTEGMINSGRCIDAIERNVIPDMRWAFPDRGGIFQQDLVQCFGRVKYFDLSNSNCFGTPPLEAQNDKTCYKFWGASPLWPPGYAYDLDSCLLSKNTN